MRNRSGQIHAAIPNWIRFSIAFVLFAAALVSGASPAAAQGGKSPAGTRIFLTIEGTTLLKNFLATHRVEMTKDPPMTNDQ